MSRQVVPFALEDPGPSALQVKGEILIGKHSIGIRFEGYGTMDVEGDEGAPVWIDMIGPLLSVSVFGDINNDLPTSISLEGARAELYEGPE